MADTQTCRAGKAITHGGDVAKAKSSVYPKPKFVGLFVAPKPAI